MASFKPASESFRRSRTKSVITRRATRSSTRSSSYGGPRSTSDYHEYDDHGNDDFDLDVEDAEILSCFLDDSADNSFLVDRVLQDSVKAKEREKQIEIELDHELLDLQLEAGASELTDNSGEISPLSSFRSHNQSFHYSDSSDLVQLRPKHKQSRRQSSEKHHHAPEAGDASQLNSGMEPMLQRNLSIETETAFTKSGITDFPDTAMSREGKDIDIRDIGLCRAEHIIYHKDRPIPDLSEQMENHPKTKIFKPTVKFGCFDIVIGLLAITVFFVDIGTDVDLAIRYFRQELWIYGGVTTGLIVWPSIITTILGLHWYMLDYKKEKKIVEKIRKAKKKAFVTPRYVWSLRILLTLLQMGPVFR